MARKSTLKSRRLTAASFALRYGVSINRRRCRMRRQPSHAVSEQAIDTGKSQIQTLVQAPAQTRFLAGEGDAVSDTGHRLHVLLRHRLLAQAGGFEGSAQPSSAQKRLHSLQLPASRRGSTPCRWAAWKSMSACAVLDTGARVIGRQNVEIPSTFDEVGDPHVPSLKRGEPLPPKGDEPVECPAQTRRGFPLVVGQTGPIREVLPSIA